MVGKVSALGLLVALLLALSVSGAATRPADAAASSSKAFSWGYNQDGELGNGTTTNTNTPGTVSNLTNVKSVKAGCSHGLALLKNGTVRAWGYNGNGELGDGTNTHSTTPVKVENITNVKAISAGCSHSLALKEDGSVWAWGFNHYGQLGNGKTGTSSNVPFKVGSLGTGARGIAAGYHFSLALMKNGTVKSWGSNTDGQLGNGTNTSRDTPGAVRGLANVKAIATDSYAEFALALTSNATVKSWGYNGFGQLGDGTYTNRSTPVGVKNLTNVKAVAAGGYHSLALLKSGKAKSWGPNDFGALGDGGTTTWRNTPGPVLGLSNVRSISGGAYHSLAVLESGNARSWGNNEHGQLGNGTSGAATNRNIPGEVRNLAGVKNIDGGHLFTLAVK
jgi:alpha-tubulin suppressor-like RCC1 family protein